MIGSRNAQTVPTARSLKPIRAQTITPYLKYGKFTHRTDSVLLEENEERVEKVMEEKAEKVERTTEVAEVRVERGSRTSRMIRGLIIRALLHQVRDCIINKG